MLYYIYYYGDTFKNLDWCILQPFFGEALMLIDLLVKHVFLADPRVENYMCQFSLCEEGTLEFFSRLPPSGKKKMLHQQQESALGMMQKRDRFWVFLGEKALMLLFLRQYVSRQGYKKSAYKQVYVFISAAWKLLEQLVASACRWLTTWNLWRCSYFIRRIVPWKK